MIGFLRMSDKNTELMESIVSLSKRRGFTPTPIQTEGLFLVTNMMYGLKSELSYCSHLDRV